MPVATSSRGARTNGDANDEALQAIKRQIGQLMSSTQELAAFFEEAPMNQQQNVPALEPQTPAAYPSVSEANQSTGTKVKITGKKMKKLGKKSKRTEFIVERVHGTPWNPNSKVERFTVGTFPTEGEAMRAAKQDYIESADEELSERSLKWRNGPGKEKSLVLKGKMGAEDAESFTVTVKELGTSKKKEATRVAPPESLPSAKLPRVKEVFVVQIEEKTKTKGKLEPPQNAQLTGVFTYGVFANLDNAIHHGQKQCEHYLECLQGLGDAHITHDQAGAHHYFATISADEADPVYTVKVLEQKLQHKRKMI